MKLTVILAAAATVFTPALGAPALAQHTVVTQRTVVHRGPAPRVAQVRRVCRTAYRHHHRVRTCRTVRY